MGSNKNREQGRHSVNHRREGENLQEGLELAALLVRLSTFLGRPLGLAAGVGAIIRLGRGGVVSDYLFRNRYS